MLTTLVSKSIIDPEHALFILESEEIAKEAQPGQFVEVRVSKGYHPLLRKPLSIFSVDGNTFGLLVKTDVYGAKLMLRWDIGEQIDVLGPLGHGFDLETARDDCILAAGGIGSAALNMLAKELLARNKRVHMLFSPKRSISVLNAFDLEKIELTVSENRTTVADELKGLFAKVNGECVVYACGPTGFLKCVAETSEECRVDSYVSLETKMACGMGACLGCAVDIRQGDEIIYKTCCTDGPVFPGREVVFK